MNAILVLDADTTNVKAILADRQAFICHVEAVGFPCRADPACGEQHIDTAARAQIEHDLSGLQFSYRRRVATTQRSLERRVRDFTFLRPIVKV